MLLELLQKGYGKAMNLNCAEKILYGANWAYNMHSGNIHIGDERVQVVVLLLTS